jgi:hypothetical protein
LEDLLDHARVEALARRRLARGRSSRRSAVRLAALLLLRRLAVLPLLLRRLTVLALLLLLLLRGLAVLLATLLRRLAVLLLALLTLLTGLAVSTARGRLARRRAVLAADDSACKRQSHFETAGHRWSSGHTSAAGAAGQGERCRGPREQPEVS